MRSYTSIHSDWKFKEHIVKQNTDLILDSPNQMIVDEIDVTLSEWIHSILLSTTKISISFTLTMFIE